MILSDIALTQLWAGTLFQGAELIGKVNLYFQNFYLTQSSDTILYPDLLQYIPRSMCACESLENCTEMSFIK